MEEVITEMVLLGVPSEVATAAALLNCSEVSSSVERGWRLRGGQLGVELTVERFTDEEDGWVVYRQGKWAKAVWSPLGGLASALSAAASMP